jgi:hypothetical protein
MRLRTINKVYQNAESELLGQMSQNDYDQMIKNDMCQSIAKVIFDKGKIPIIKLDSRKDNLGIRGEQHFFQYECECILLSREEYEKITEALRTIKNTL